MNFFDSGILSFINQISQHSWIFDRFVVALSDNGLLKGGVLAMAVWFTWFSDTGLTSNRRHILATLLACLAAIAVGRGLALALPFRLRPAHDGTLDFLLPYGIAPTTLEGWSSFPSDHAVLFFALSAGLLFVSRKIGVLALVYTALVIAFPRLYVGFHYPSDLLGGAITGIGIALAANVYLVKSTVFNAAAALLLSKPRMFYPLLFLLTYQIADTFNSSRALAIAAARLLQIID